MNYKVSIIIPTYKREPKFLKRALDSILNQTYTNIEVIIVDDNGGENLKLYREKIQKLMKEYENNVKVQFKLNEKNLGGSLSRNEGINIASGQYITFLDDDDIYLPHKVENQLKYMIENGLDMSFTDLVLHNEDDKVVDYREYRKINNFDSNYLLRYHITRHITGTPTFMYKKEAINKIGGFTDAKMGQEFYLMLKSIESNMKIGYLQKCDVIAYRHKGEGISNGKNKIIGEKNLYSFKQKYFNKLNNKEIRYVNFRHCIVMAIAYKRNNQLGLMVTSILKALVVSPIDFISDGLNQTKKILFGGR